MEEKELKTLKDIQRFAEEDDDSFLEYDMQPDEAMDTTIEAIRIEAIKEVRELGKINEPLDYAKCIGYGFIDFNKEKTFIEKFGDNKVIEYIKWKNNLNDEDIKNYEEDNENN